MEEQDTFYTLSPSHLVLDNPGRRYVLRIRDLPIEQKPREKMVRHGPSVLSTPELLAVILNTGSTKEEVMTMSARIMNEYGKQSIMHARNPKKLAEDAGIPLGKATQIVAVAELGRRFFQKNSASAPTIRTAQEVFDYVRDMCELSKEHLRGIYLNAHYKVIHEETISIGTVDANIIHPREVFKPAIEYSAAAVILVHNHPSGSVEPSESDKEVTKQLVTAGTILGIDLVDHVIVTKDAFASIPVQY
jgi:DNA repair protein RadC